MSYIEKLVIMFLEGYDQLAPLDQVLILAVFVMLVFFATLMFCSNPIMGLIRVVGAAVKRSSGVMKTAIVCFTIVAVALLAYFAFSDYLEYRLADPAGKVILVDTTPFADLIRDGVQYLEDVIIFWTEGAVVLFLLVCVFLACFCVFLLVAGLLLTLVLGGYFAAKFARKHPDGILQILFVLVLIGAFIYGVSHGWFSGENPLDDLQKEEIFVSPHASPDADVLITPTPTVVFPESDWDASEEDPDLESPSVEPEPTPVVIQHEQNAPPLIEVDGDLVPLDGEAFVLEERPDGDRFKYYKELFSRMGKKVVSDFGQVWFDFRYVETRSMIWNGSEDPVPVHIAHVMCPIGTYPYVGKVLEVYDHSEHVPGTNLFVIGWAGSDHVGGHLGYEDDPLGADGESFGDIWISAP